MPQTIKYCFTCEELQEMTGPVPYAVQIRLILNKHGFKFTDDGKPSLIINEHPMPLGTFTRWEDIESRQVCYKQVLDE